MMGKLSTIFVGIYKGPSVNEILIEIFLRKRLDDANIRWKGLKMASA